MELSLQVHKEISETKHFLTTASYQSVNLKDIKLNPIVRRFPDEEGIIQIARLGTSFISDTRDEPSIQSGESSVRVLSRLPTNTWGPK